MILKSKQPLTFLDALFCDGYIYFSAANVNGLFRAKTGNGEATLLAEFKQEAKDEILLHRRLFREGDDIYITPFLGNGISVYDTTSDDITYIEIRNEGRGAYVDTIRYHDDLIMIPEYILKGLDVFHIQEQSVEKVFLENVIGNEFCEPIDMYRIAFTGNTLYILSKNGDKLLSVQIDDRKTSEIHLNESATIMCIEKGRVLLFNDEGGKINADQSKCSHENEQSLKEQILTIQSVGDYSIMLPVTGRRIYITKNQERWKEIMLPEGTLCEKVFYGYVPFADADFFDDSIWLFPFESNEMLRICPKSREIISITMHMRNEDAVYLSDSIGQMLKKQFNQKLMHGEVIYEGMGYCSDIDHYISVLDDILPT